MPFVKHIFFFFFQLQICNGHRGTHIEGLEYYNFISKYRFKCCEFEYIAAFLLFPHSSFFVDHKRKCFGTFEAHSIYV